jgi:hypothetical protein
MNSKKGEGYKIQNLVMLPEEVVYELLENQKIILSSLIHKPNTAIAEWLTEKEVQGFLGKKTTSLWSLRKKCQLTFTKIGSKVFYSKADILKLLEDNKKKRIAGSQ